MDTRPLGELTETQRDVVAILASKGPISGRDVWRALEKLRAEKVSYQTAYRNLDTLHVRGIVDKENVDDREKRFYLTEAGEGLWQLELDWINSL